jgi:Cu(I)/Ag(I) efflux system membrane fusion protein
MRLKSFGIRIVAMALAGVAMGLQAAEPPPATPERPSAATPATFKGTGQVVDFVAQERLITVAHDDMPSLGMPAMTMDFPVAASVDPATITLGQTVSFVLTLIDGILTVTEIRPAAGLRGGSGQ